MRSLGLWEDEEAEPQQQAAHSQDARSAGDGGMVDISACSIGEGIQSSRHACRGSQEYVLAA
jgi:hypothetical protein